MLILLPDNKIFFLKSNQRGTLLMKTLVAFGIIALLTTISLPYLRKYQPNLKLNSTARDLTADLRYTQQLTITEQIVYQVYLDTGNNSYQIIKTGAATTTIRDVDLPSQVSFLQVTDLTNNTVSFNSYGGVSESGQIVLTNINDRLAVINIRPSGYVQLVQ